MHNHNFAVMPMGHTNACPVLLWDGGGGESANLGGRKKKSSFSRIQFFFTGERFGFVEGRASRLRGYGIPALTGLAHPVQTVMARLRAREGSW